MASVSLCMIVKNEEVVLKRCIDSVRDAVDEVIIVDTGSQDNTRAIASELTPKVYDFEWIDDFAAARNYAFSLASCDYIM
ncbi:MAG: glycosyltransferase, partial [Christensenellales bacterium]